MPSIVTTLYHQLKLLTAARCFKIVDNCHTWQSGGSYMLEEAVAVVLIYSVSLQRLRGFHCHQCVAEAAAHHEASQDLQKQRP